ncbi:MULTISPECIES: diguanylate cyclase [unclassified Clostridium]|uniref:diguanylate cyclase n=1 Tax=unclassified Clostridium TaxID=2614128 RepID=UPI000297F2B8|nr:MULTISPECIES: diguanylate cyclase [unclassified Clostridium]EKQ55405.1 MAG: diguanylate cyclase (GGDEF) domain-containing protein [Clostridium sp. Maddingley MBC34-26]
MRNVNNKYQIEYELTVEENFSNYLVLDSENNAKYVLCILKNDFTYEKTREYLLSKFKAIKNLNFDYMVNTVDIEIIHSINGIKLNKPQYGYLMEYVESKINTQDYLKRCTPYKKLDIFMELCAAINTLNKKGYIFDDISIKDIKLVPISRNNVKVKIKNLLQNEFRKFNLLNSSFSSYPYQYNIESRDEGNSNKDNIELVIKLFNQIFNEEDIKTHLVELKHIKKIYNQNTINMSLNIKYFIKDINNRLEKNYKLFFVDDLNKLNTNLDIIGMEEELKIVEKNLQKVLESKEKHKIIAFNGEDGSGKSRLLEEIRYKIENKYFKDIIYVKDFSDNNLSMEELYNYILNSILRKVDKNLKDKYEIYLKKFVSILIVGNSVSNESKQKHQLINRIGKFINEYTMTKPFIIIIDDLDQRNEVFKLFIRYITFLGSNLENTIIIFSMNESKSSGSFLEFINNLKRLEQYEEYKINYLNQYNTTKMIKSMLNTNEDIDKLAVKIYSETLGNPQYISGVIKELYENKSLYFDEVSGKWKNNIKTKDILIPKTLESRLEAGLSLLVKKEIEVIKKLSIFETPLSEKIILEYVITEIDDVRVYRHLKSKGILSDKISDQGILVGFTNNLLRNIVYLKLNEEEKMKLHSNAAIFMEEILFETDYYIEEFLIHLERSNDYKKAQFYALKYADGQDALGNSEKALSYYKKVLKYPNCLNGSSVAINIAKLYEKNSEHEKSYEYFEKANQYAVQNDDLQNQIYTLLEMIIIKINDTTNMDTEIEYFLNYARKLLDKKFFAKGEAYYYYALALKYELEYNYKQTLVNAEKVLIICRENRIKEDINGWAAITLAGVYIKEGIYTEAKNYCIHAIEIFVDNNNINGELYCKLFYSSICKIEGDDNNIILQQYLEVTRLSNKFKVYKKEILSLIYIANIYSIEKRYALAEKYLLRALEREREEGIDSYSFNICSEFCLLYIKLGRTNLAVKYYYLTKQMQKGLKLSEEEVININYTYALYNLLICNYDLAYDYLKEVYTLIFNTNNFHYKIIICNYYELMLYKCKSEEDIRTVYGKLDERIKKIENQEAELEIRLNAIRRILFLGYNNFAKELFFNLTGYPKDYNMEGIYLYLEFNFREKNYYNFLINKALRICVFVNNQEIKADIYAMIGQKYRELKCSALAINYYYEAIALHLDTINFLPQGDKLKYVNNSGFLSVRKNFMECLNHDLNINMKFKEIKPIKEHEELNRTLKELNLKNILGNKAVYQLAQNLYEKCYYNDFSDIYKVFKKFSNDTIIDIGNIIKYMARLTLADKAMIVIENNEGENDIICTYRITDKNEINKYFSINVDSEEDIFVICNSDARFYQLDDKILKDEIKSCMYMKIINREKNINSSTGINARLILIANSAMNNINEDSKKIIEQFKPFLTFLLEKHKLTITSTLDKLTGAYNRKYFEEALLYLLDNAKLEKRDFAVMMFDIDDFKGVNDKYGHQTGDEVLVKLSKEVKKCLGKSDIIGRYGGEEFIILLPNSNKEKAINMAEKMRSNVADAKILGDKRNITISIGVAVSDHESLNSEEIIERADQALYKAKHEGKNRYVLWDNDYGVSSNAGNELTGVLSGNATQDYNLALNLKEVANLVKFKADQQDKIYQFILKIMHVIECETATVFIIKDKRIINKYSKSRAKDGWNMGEKFNFDLIYEVIEQGKGVYLVDWDNMDNHNQFGIPDWKSVCITPVMCNGEILAVLYLSVSVNKKEFSCNDFNLLNCFVEIGIPIFY